MAEYLIQSETLDDIADAINAKTGGSSAMTPAEMATAIAAIPSGGGGMHESGEIAYHSGESTTAISIPISDEMAALDYYVVAARPIKTWKLVDGVWTEQDSLDFSGTTFFSAGNWNPTLAVLLCAQWKQYVNGFSRPYIAVGKYSNDTTGNRVTGYLAVDSVNKCLNVTELNGAKVCGTDCGLTYRYDIWGWN